MKTRIKKVYMTLPGIQDRKNLAWIPPYFSGWPEKYKVRAGFGMNLNDYAFIGNPVWHYTYQGKHYWIEREKALNEVVDTKLNPVFPQTIPLEAWNVEVIPAKL
jgi:hypothetical protein